LGDKRHWLVRFSAEILVLLLLVFGVASYQYDLGERWLGWGPADPRTDPSAVLPPEGLRLPAAGAVPAIAQQGAAVAVDPARVAAVVQPLIRKRVLGRHYGVLVTDIATGRPVYKQGATTVTPASTTKLVTGMAALEALGPMVRFRTSVRWVPSTRQLVLVGGGDPFLVSSPRLGTSTYPDRADIQTLARSTVRESAREARRTLARHVYRRSLELSADTSRTLQIPPAMVWISQLAQLQRACLALCMFGGHTHREAAALLGVPPTTVAALLTSGLTELGRLAAGEPTRG